jgi:CheY-like chemotaxis protein
MSSENISVELDSKFIDEFYALADMSAPEEVTLESLKEVVTKIKEKINKALLGSNAPKTSDITKPELQNVFLQGGEKPEKTVRAKRVLIVDDLGIITYQLEVLYKRMGFEVSVSNEINDAIEKFKKQDYGYAVIDLFIPTDREGFILLDELKKLSLLCKLNTMIIVMTASSKPEYKINCKNHGADHYIEKAPGWQKELMSVCM